MHVHVVSGSGEAKFWLEPCIELADKLNYSNMQLRQIETIIEAHYDELISAWRQHFSR